MAARDDSIKFVFLSTLSLRRATRLQVTDTLHHWGISIHALLAESDPEAPVLEALSKDISIHALLAESDLALVICTPWGTGYFYPRSPCGERRHGVRIAEIDFAFLSTLSLRRATDVACGDRHKLCDFYPRSPCGERLCRLPGTTPWACYFYPRSPCGERPTSQVPTWFGMLNFYPRSPCGERPAVIKNSTAFSVFLSTLSLRRATDTAIRELGKARISIHALLAESDTDAIIGCNSDFISIHALLAESDAPNRRPYHCNKNFYPRSPCGERPLNGFAILWNTCISIHALLAESDVHYDNYNLHCVISIHALLAESDVTGSESQKLILHFYPRSPCGERQLAARDGLADAVFLSTLSLRRATRASQSYSLAIMHFYPRSPCGERRSASRYLSIPS